MGRSIRVRTLEEFERFKKIIFDDSIAPFLFRKINVTKSNAEHIKEKDLNNDMVCYLLINDDEDIGMAAGYLFKNINKMVVDIGILQSFRGNFSKEYMVEILKDFYSDEENKGIEIWGYVKKENIRCLKFVEKLGAKIIREIYGNYIMRLDYV